MMSARLAAIVILLGTGCAMAQPVRPGRSPSAAPAPVVSGPAAVPQQTTATYGDWTLRCVQPAGAAKICEVVQVVQQDGKPVAQMAVGAPSKDQKLQFTVLVPPSVSFVPAPALVPPGDDGASLALTWRRCLPGGCMADTEIADEALARLRGWTQAARVTFADAAGRVVTLPLSPIGLAQALDALAKEGAG